jgi:DnaJ-class molecular chaperone
MDCRYCSTAITQDRYAFVEVYVDKDLNELCRRGQLRKCPECAGTGMDHACAFPKDCESCRSCGGKKKIRLHWPVRS